MEDLAATQPNRGQGDVSANRALGDRPSAFAWRSAPKGRRIAGT